MREYVKNNLIEIEKKTAGLAEFEQYADDHAEEYEVDFEDNENNNLKVSCELVREDTLELGLNADGSIFITVIGANAEYTIVPSRENLAKTSSGINKLLYITEDITDEF